MNRIIIHWTAGRNYPTEYEKRFYHYLIDKDGKIHNGIYKPEDNLNCKDGEYAAHTGGGNTGSIGIAICAMEGFINKDISIKHTITAIQFEACMKFCAQICKKYNLNINPQTVMTHYEFGKKHPKTTSAGKIDITYIPCYPHIAKDDVGNFIRTKIRWYISKI